MRERAAQGTWVEIHRIVLSPEGRARKVPDDTRRVPLEMKVKGFLVREAILGEEAEILTSLIAPSQLEKRFKGGEKDVGTLG